MSTATDNEQIIEEAFVLLTPQFHYSRHVEVIKRFTEQITALHREIEEQEAAIGEPTDRLHGYLDANLDYLRDAVSQVLVDDIERQIQLTKDFPHGRRIEFHPFKQSTNPNVGSDSCGEFGSQGRCTRVPTDMVHTL